MNIVIFGLSKSAILNNTKMKKKKIKKAKFLLQDFFKQREDINF